MRDLKMFLVFLGVMAAVIIGFFAVKDAEAAEGEPSFEDRVRVAKLVLDGKSVIFNVHFDSRMNVNQADSLHVHNCHFQKDRNNHVQFNRIKKFFGGEIEKESFFSNVKDTSI